MDFSRISVVLPSLDPDEKLVTVIDGLLEYGFQDIILVNDGSKQENLHYFTDAAAAHPEITLLHHEVNRGKGVALKTAFTWYLANRKDGIGVVTVDGDNQHHPADILACSEHMAETNHITLGCRDFSLDHVPARSRFGNHATSLVFKLFVGMTISDTQTGLRAIPAKYLELMNQVSGDRFEYETNMLLAIKDNRIPMDEVKIRTVYIEENKSSHFHVIRDSWRIYKLILSHFIRFAISSVISAIVDVGGFALLSVLLDSVLDGLVLTVVAGGASRIVSSLLNFYVNKILVFGQKGSTGRAMLRYFMLAVPQMCAQVLLTQGVCSLLGITDAQVGLKTLWYVIVMAVLFLASYMIQQRWVFAHDTKNN